MSKKYPIPTFEVEEGEVLNISRTTPYPATGWRVQLFHAGRSISRVISDTQLESAKFPTAVVNHVLNEARKELLAGGAE